MTKTHQAIGAILLVSGTTIGAGMLALPVTTGRAGFIPSLALMLLLWLFMLLTAFYFLEVHSQMKEAGNIISMARETLSSKMGRGGEVVTWICYLLLLYSLLAAYIVGCSQILSHILSAYFKEVPELLWPLMIFIVFGAFIYFGTRSVDHVNRILMTGLVVGYLGLIFLGIFHIDLNLLAHKNWAFLAASTSVMITSFGYHIIIPTLSNYLDHNLPLLKKVIVIGSLIPFLVYLLWQALAMGVIPVEGDPSLANAAEKGLQVTFCLTEIIGNPWISFFARLFAFFAMITSLLGVALSLSDFLADGLKLKRNQWSNLFLLFLTFIPPLFFAIFYPKGFILALKYAGIFVVILLGLLPIAMVYFKRYHMSKKEERSGFQVVGGKPLLFIAFIFSLLLLSVEVLL